MQILSRRMETYRARGKSVISEGEVIAAIYLVALLVAAYGYNQLLKLLKAALDYEPKVRVVVRLQDWRPK